jgi:hypothetical protein
MAKWRFYQGLRTEWRWYHVDEHGSLTAESDRGFAELQGCMANAAEAGFTTGEAFQVYTRQAGSFADSHPVRVEEALDELPIAADVDAADKQPAT